MALRTSEARALGESACALLASLAEQAPFHARAIAHQGLEALLTAMWRHAGSPAVQGRACAALAVLARDHGVLLALRTPDPRDPLQESAMEGGRSGA